MINVVTKKNDYKQKTKSEIREIKARKCNLDITFRNKTIIHFNADSDKPTIVDHKKQPTKQQKIDRSYGIKTTKD
jgi:hypothetical protein